MEHKEENEDKPQFNITDRRRISLDEIDEEVPEYERKLPTYIEQLQEQLSAKDKKLKERLKSLKTENDVYKKRLQSKMEKRAESSLMELYSALLEVVDNLDRALETSRVEHSHDKLMQGMSLIRDHFLNILKKAGITPLEILSTPFNPDLAEAMGVVEIDDPQKDNVVIDEFSKGYRYNDKLLRPAMVRVGKLKKRIKPKPSVPKKFPCPDCRFCQWCADSRCTMCRRGISCS